MNDVTQDTITPQMEEAQSLPVADTPESIQQKLEALRADPNAEAPVPVSSGFVQTEDEVSGSPLPM